MPTTTTDTAAVNAAKEILSRGDWFEPMTVGAEIEALKKILAQSPRPDLTAKITVAGQIISVERLLAGLSQFNRALINPLDNRLFADLTTLKPEHLTVLEKGLAAFIAPAETEASMDSVVPTKAKLQELQNILKAQAETTAGLKQKLGRPEQLKTQLEHAQKINIQAQLLRVSVSKNLFLTLTESSYIRDLQTIYGKEAVNNFLAQRIDLAVNQSITALTLNQLGIADPSHAAAYFAGQLEKNLKADRNLAVALAKTPKAERKNVLEDAEIMAEETAKEVHPAAKAFQAEQRSSPIYKDNAKAIAQGEAEAALVRAGQRLTAKQTARLTEALAKHRDPEMQSRILRRILPGASAEARQEILNSIQPALLALAGSSSRPTIAETISENSLINLARTSPELFPFRLRAAIKDGKLSSEEISALTVRLSTQLGQPPDYVMMRLAGISGKDIEAHLNSLASGKPVFGLPTQAPVSPAHLIVRRLSAAQSGLNQIQASGEEFQAINLGLQNSWQSIVQTLDIGKAIRFNFGRLPPVNRMFSSAQTVFSGLRVQSEAVNSVFNFFSTVTGGFGKMGRAAAAPFRAVGTAISAGFNNVKTWAGTQIKSGLAKAGAWLIKAGGKKLVDAGAKLGLLAIGKGAAALVAQAVPGIGTAAGILTGLSVLGDIGRFVWNNRKGIGTAVAGGLFFGQTLLSGLFGLLGQFGGLAFTTGGGALIGTLILPGAGTAIGAGLGFATGLGIQAAGGLGSVLSGAGSALGSVALGLGNMAALLGAPGLIAGLGSTVAAAGIAGIALGAVITVFFVQPTTNAGLFVPSSQQNNFGGPPAKSCFVFADGNTPYPKVYDEKTPSPEFSDPWNKGDSERINGSLEVMLTKFPAFMNKVCQGGKITLWRDSHHQIPWGGWMMANRDIRIYNNGVSDNLYTMSHELGHVYDFSLGNHGFPLKLFVFWNPISGQCERNIYPAAPGTVGDCYAENFAEGISWLISNKNTLPMAWHNWLSNTVFK